MLPDIDFEKIRLHRGTKDYAFEELCCQIAALETRPTDSTHHRKGRGSDGGLECFTKFTDGKETGWQVKYYWKMDSSLTSSLTKSFDAAVEKHPGLTRFVVCIPFDLPDGARGVTALETWTTWKSDRVATAKILGRAIEIDLWGASELKDRLGRDEPARLGRTLFWFGVERLSPEWFAAKLARTIAALGSRYTAESSVTLPIRQVLEAVCRTDALNTQRRAWRDRLASVRRPASETFAAAGPGVTLTERIDRLQTCLDEEDIPPEADFPVLELKGLVSDALDALKPIERQDWLRERGDPSTGFERSTIRQLGEVLTAIADGLRENHWTHANDRSLLITGVAGRGKSHLLADACLHAVESGCPTLLLMSSKFVEGDIWQQILADLDMRDVDVKTFLGALDAAAEAAGSRLAIMIDGINERNGLAIWPENMVSFIHDVHRYPRLAVVFSCRSTYVGYALPDGLSETELPRIEHMGFSAEDALAYVAHRKIALPSHPFPLDELGTPLFLKVCCDALEKNGTGVFPRGARGVSAIFDFYSKAVVGSINRSLNLNAGRHFVERAITAIADEIDKTGEREIPYDRAADILDGVRTGNGRSDDDLLFLLEHEGLLAREPAYAEDEDDGTEGGTESVRFVFERYSDHVVAKSILDAIPSDHDFAKSPLPPRLSNVLTNQDSFIDPGVMEAVAVQFPERFGVELYDIARDDMERWRTSYAFLCSVTARHPSKVSLRTIELLSEVGEPHERVDARISLAIEDTCPFNADQIHASLSSMSMADRDAAWTVEVTETFGHDHSRIAKLIDWSMSVDATPIDEKAASLTATTLSWLLSSPSLAMRDRATKSLAAILAAHPGIVPGVLERFAGVDDLYVVERLVAATYGAAMQGRWTIAEHDEIVRQAFAKFRDLPPNILVRDHLRSLVSHARLAGCPLSGVPDPIVWASKWPLEHVPDRVVATYTKTYPDRHKGRDEIVASALESGDFARYVVDKLAQHYSTAPIGSMHLPTRNEIRMDWIAKFNASEPQDRRDALVNLLQAEELDRTNQQWQPSQQLVDARDEFATLVGEDAFEDYRTIAMDWRRGVMYQEHPRGGGPECFNMGWARRWVCWKAHELGWQAGLHGEFDANIRRDRFSNHVERLGKKYQWLALFELAARFADNLEPLPSRYGGGFEWLRNIDPSLLVRATGESGPSVRMSYWAHVPTVKTTSSPQDGIRWRDAESDFMDGPGTIEITDHQSGREWLNLGSFQSWSRNSVGGNKRFRYDAWARVNSVVVPAADLRKALSHLLRLDLRNENDLPSNETVDDTMHLGEHGWLNDPNELSPVTSWASVWKSNRWKDLTIPAFPTTNRYERSPVDRDQSLEGEVRLTIPSFWLMRAMGARLVDGRTAAYADAKGAPVFFDPSVKFGGPSAGLAGRREFLTYLDENGLVAIWACAGEKNLYTEDQDGFGGRRWYSTISHSTPTGIVYKKRTTELEGPSRTQLDQFLGEPRPVSSLRTSVE